MKTEISILSNTFVLEDAEKYLGAVPMYYKVCIVDLIKGQLYDTPGKFIVGDFWTTPKNAIVPSSIRDDEFLVQPIKSEEFYVHKEESPHTRERITVSKGLTITDSISEAELLYFHSLPFLNDFHAPVILCVQAYNEMSSTLEGRPIFEGMSVYHQKPVLTTRGSVSMLPNIYKASCGIADHFIALRLDEYKEGSPLKVTTSRIGFKHLLTNPHVLNEVGQYADSFIKVPREILLNGGHLPEKKPSSFEVREDDFPFLKASIDAGRIAMDDIKATFLKESLSELARKTAVDTRKLLGLD